VAAGPFFALAEEQVPVELELEREPGEGVPVHQARPHLREVALVYVRVPPEEHVADDVRQDSVPEELEPLVRFEPRALLLVQV